MTTSKSTQEIAAEHFRTLKHYLDTVEMLPARGGKLNISAVAEACGFDRASSIPTPNAIGCSSPSLKGGDLAVSPSATTTRQMNNGASSNIASINWSSATRR